MSRDDAAEGALLGVSPLYRIDGTRVPPTSLKTWLTLQRRFSDADETVDVWDATDRVSSDRPQLSGSPNTAGGSDEVGEDTFWYRVAMTRVQLLERWVRVKQTLHSPVYIHSFTYDV